LRPSRPANVYPQTGANTDSKPQETITYRNLRPGLSPMLTGERVYGVTGYAAPKSSVKGNEFALVPRK